MRSLILKWNKIKKLDEIDKWNEMKMDMKWNKNEMNLKNYIKWK